MKVVATYIGFDKDDLFGQYLCIIHQTEDRKFYTLREGTVGNVSPQEITEEKAAELVDNFNKEQNAG